VGRCSGGSITTGTAVGTWVPGRVMAILEHNYVIIDGEGEGGDEIKG